MRVNQPGARQVRAQSRSAGAVAIVVLVLASAVMPAAGAPVVTQIIDAKGDGVHPVTYPMALAVDSSRNVFVADVARAFRIGTDGAISQIIDATGDGVHPLGSPNYLTTDPAGNVYLSAARPEPPSLEGVFRITPAGAVSQVLDGTGDGLHPMTFPFAIATDSIGDLYAGAIWSGNVFRRAPDGTTVQVLDATGDGVHPLEYPCGIAVDANDNVYVLGSGGIFQLDPNGAVTRFIPFTPLGCGLDVDKDLNLYAIECVNCSPFFEVLYRSRVVRIAPDGTRTAVLGPEGDGTREFRLGLWVKVDHEGTVYAAAAAPLDFAWGTNNVFQVTPGGTVTQILDTSGDGTHPMSDPTGGLAVDATGNVYVAAIATNNVFRISFPLEAAIDIKPGSDSNPVNLRSRGVLPTAILGSSTLHVDEIDVTTLAFGPAHASPAHDPGGPGDPVARADRAQDINGDGFPDLVVHFAVQEAGIACGDTKAALSGALRDGRTFEGHDTITPLGCR